MSARSMARKMLNNGLYTLARWMPLPLYRLVLPRSPVGFFYHAVSDQPLPHVQHLYPIKSTRAFEQDLMYLQENFTLVGYEALQAHAEGTRRLPDNAAFLSFDDGFSVCHSVAVPLLKKHGLSAMFFLATDWIDNRAMYYRSVISLVIDRLLKLDSWDGSRALEQLNREVDASIPASGLQSALSWLLLRTAADRPLLDRICELLEIEVGTYLQEQRPFLSTAEIRDMHSDGFTIGAHTRSHTKLMDLSPEMQREEIVESCRVISQITGSDQVPFAFPFSGHRVDRDMLSELRQAQPHIGLIFDTKKLDQDRPFIFNRIMVDKPVPGISDERNLAYWLQQAYAAQVQV